MSRYETTLGAFLTSLLKLLKSCVICKSISQFGGKQEAKFEKFSYKAEFILVPKKKKREHIQYFLDVIKEEVLVCYFEFSNPDLKLLV